MLLSAFTNFPRGGGNMTTKLWLRLCLSRKPKVAALWGWVYLKGQVQFYNNPDFDFENPSRKSRETAFLGREKVTSGQLPVLWSHFGSDDFTPLQTNSAVFTFWKSVLGKSRNGLTSCPVTWLLVWRHPFLSEGTNPRQRTSLVFKFGKICLREAEIWYFSSTLDLCDLSLSLSQPHTHTAYWLWPQVTS